VAAHVEGTSRNLRQERGSAPAVPTHPRCVQYASVLKRALTNGRYFQPDGIGLFGRNSASELVQRTIDGQKRGC